MDLPLREARHQGGGIRARPAQAHEVGRAAGDGGRREAQGRRALDEPRREGPEVGLDPGGADLPEEVIPCTAMGRVTKLLRSPMS